MNHNHFNILIAGGGLAGLSLAYHLLEAGFQGTIGIVDRDKKERNDRTWCFWEEKPGPFEAIVCQSWDRLDFFSPTFESLLDIRPFSYKMIRGIDFYEFVKTRLLASGQVEWIEGEVAATRSLPESGELTLADGRRLEGDWLYSSMLRQKPDTSGCHYLDQHFKGWVIRTPEPCFDPQRATLMDFRIPQHNQSRFFYVLPTDAHTALVEVAIFSKEHLTSEGYDALIRDYIQTYLKLPAYEIIHDEMGAIPMTDYRFPRQNGREIFIGTAGGHTKASTGYTFWRLQENLQALARQITKTGSPLPLPALARPRYALFDGTLLEVLEKNTVPSERLFADLFRKNPPARVLRFLNEKTSLAEDLALMATVPLGPFIKAFWNVTSYELGITKGATPNS